MLKKILIGLGALAVIIVAALLYMNNRNRTMSPPGNVELTSADLKVTISYNRPSVRNRVIFATKEEGALQPYGQYWRLGANEATEITFSKAVNFNGSAVKAGTYRIYAVPGPDTFDIILNSELGKWGVSEADHQFDVMSTKVLVEKLDPPIEVYTIRLEPIENGMNAVFEWEKVRLTVPVLVQ